MIEETLKALNEKQNVPTNCSNKIVLKCQSEIWKSNRTAAYGTNETSLESIQNFSVKEAEAVTEACEKMLNNMNKMKQDQSKELVSPLIDCLTFLGKAITDMKKFRGNSLK